MLELHGLLLLVRWILRKEGNQHAHATCLVDAKAVLGAAAKGRTSSKPLLRVLRMLAAELLAGDLTLHLVYVPSEDNPADRPSRGFRQRATTRRCHLKVKKRAKRYLSAQRMFPRIFHSPYAEELLTLHGMQAASCQSSSKTCASS